MESVYSRFCGRSSLQNSLNLLLIVLILIGPAIPVEQAHAQEPVLPDEPFNYANLELPAHYTTNAFPAQNNGQGAAVQFDSTPAANPVTDHGATLGRVLFYDQRLSANGTVSCASCHQAEHGFSDPDVLSVGFDGGLTGRHSMGLTNARYSVTGKFFWDERADTLEEQVLMPFQDPVEMGLTLEQVEQIVGEQSYYTPLFESAFGDAQVSSDRVASALAQFIRSMVSTTSKYDIARAEVTSPLVDFPGFTQEENDGKSIFFTEGTTSNAGRVTCAQCHVSEAFVGPMLVGNQTTNAANIGLDAVSTDDLGIFESTGNPADVGKFKVTSLRNIAVTAPYMHDGRFATLGDVIDHYSTGIEAHNNLDNRLVGQGGVPVQFGFSEVEKAALLAFLNTLTDAEMLSDEKFSDPFKLIGDFDEDGDVDSDDVEFYAGNLGASAEGELEVLDLDEDGVVTILDHDLLINDHIHTIAGTGTLVGDINLDGEVSLLGDAFPLVGSLGMTGTDWSSGDLNCDNQTSLLGDAFLLIGNLGLVANP